MAGIEGYSVTAGSNNAASPNGWPEGMAPSGVNDSDRQFAAVVRAEWASTSLTSSSTLSIGNNVAGIGSYIHVCTDANKSISSFDTISAGIRRTLVFDVAATVVHDATKLICPGATSMTMAAGDILDVVSEGSGNWRVTSVIRASGSIIGPNLSVPGTTSLSGATVLTTTLTVGGAVGITGTLSAASVVSIGGTLGVTGAITQGGWTIDSSQGRCLNNGAGTAQKFFEVANTGNGGFYIGIESSVAAAFFANSVAYESVLYSTGNNIFVNTPMLRIGTAATVGTTLGVTGALTGTTAAFTKAAAGDTITFTNGGATPKTGYLGSDSASVYFNNAGGGALNGEAVVLDAQSHIARIFGGSPTAEQIRVNCISSATRYLIFAGSNGSNPTISVSAGGLSVYAGASSALTLGTTDADTTPRKQVEVVFITGADRYIKLSGSNGGNPTIDVSAGSLAITPAVVMASTLSAAAPTFAGTVSTYHANATAGAGYLHQTQTNTTGSTQAAIGDWGFIQDTTNERSGYFVIRPLKSGVQTEAARVTKAGYFKASPNGVYLSATGAYHELYQTADTAVQVLVMTHNGATATNQYGMQLTLTLDPNDTTRYFAKFIGNATTRCSIWSDGSIDSKTQAQNNNTVKVATTAYVDRAARGLLSTEQATTSGTTKNFTDVPSGCTHFEVMFVGISLSGTDNFRIQLGSAALTTTGYLNTGAGGSNGTTISAANDTSGFSLPSGSATAVWHGKISFTLENASSNTWVAEGTLGRSDTNGWATVGGSVPLSGGIDRWSLLTNGANSFDAGAVNARYW